MLYEIIQPPFTLEFFKMQKEELRAYAKWFHEVTPERRDALVRAINATPGFGPWDADFSRASLDTLSRWFHASISTRPNTAGERQEIESATKYPVEAPQDTLTERSLSIAMDTGMYLGSVLIHSMPGTSWSQDMAKGSIDYGQPVIGGFGQVQFNPVRMCTTMAFGMLAGSRGPDDLTAIFDIWAQYRV